jgi:hypothetical protein
MSATFIGLNLAKLCFRSTALMPTARWLGRSGCGGRRCWRSRESEEEALLQDQPPPATSFILPRCNNAHLWGIICLYSPLRIRMNALSIRKLFLIVICLLAASVLIDFAHMVLSMIIDGVLAVAIVYFLWRIKGQYDKRITELEAEVRLLVSRRPGG